jgi:protein-tyrosine-phosphatase/predicted ATP-grasp superfamily ATP-dependent carboligase
MNNSVGKYDGKALVLGNDNRSFLTVIRSLGRKNICVHVGWCNLHIHALKSKYIFQIHNIPSFSLTNDDWKNFLIKLFKAEQYDLVIPCNDSSIIPLQMFRREFEELTKLYLLEDKCYRIANDKFEMQRLAQKLGLNVAKEINISKATLAENIISRFQLPVVIKPKASFTKEKISQKEYVFKIYGRKELEHFLSKNDNYENFVIQENFIGKGAGIEILAKSGKILVAFQHVRIHEPLTGGGSSYRMSVQPFDSLLKASQKIIKALNYTGVAMIEYKFNPATNDWIFIEINARFWGSLPLPVACGINFPYFLYLMLIKNQTEFNQSYKSGIFCRNTANDIRWMIANLEADRNDPTLATRHLGKVFLEIFNPIFFKERNDTLVLDDLKPGFAELKGSSGYYFKTAFRKIYHKIIQFSIIRVFKKQKAMQLFAKASSVLFICKGNICRSPFAHYYLESKKIPNLSIDSCGYFPKKDRPCPKEAVQAAKMIGIDLSLHRSKIVNEDLIKKADVIFVFDIANYRVICDSFKFAKYKIFMISALNEKIPFQVKDPYGSDIKQFSDTYDLIIKLLDSVENKIHSIQSE